MTTNGHLSLLFVLLMGWAVVVDAASDPVSDATASAAKSTLLKRHGPAEKARIDRGVDQVRRYWRSDDGDSGAFSSFIQKEFIPQGPTLDATFDRFELALERLSGYMSSLNRDLRQGADLDLGPLLPLEERLAAFNPAAHVSDDLFANQIAFVALLNFPLHTLDERLAQGMSWNRRQWAETRLAERFSTRVPASVQAARLRCRLQHLHAPCPDSRR